ncbi:MAG: non-ribosomal peptide synthetase, partial [Longimicrobiaceae bacterium]
MLLRLGAEDHVLLLSMHHIVSDGWSMGVLQRELGALYAAYRDGRESPLPELPVQYADYAVWQREHLRGDVLERQLSYWRERLAGAPELLELPTDRPRPAVQTYRGATVPMELSPELLERLQALGRSEGATLYMTLLGAFQVLLGKYAGSEDVVVGSPIAGRTRGEVEELIGFFVNTLVLRTDLSGDPSFREVLRRVRKATLGAYEHQEVPFEKLVVELQPERSLSHSPLFQVMFTLQNAGGGGGALPGLSVRAVGAEHASAQFDLSLELAATPQGLRGELIYSTDLFERGTALRMLGHLARVLEQVAADADVRLSRLELLGEAERALVLEGWNRTAAEYPADRCIHELFEAQAARTPHAEAVRDARGALGYAELNGKANTLARALEAERVRPGDIVAVLAERSADFLALMLGIWKAGAVYLPLDPRWPAERIRAVLRQSGARLLVADAGHEAPAAESAGTLAQVRGLAALLAAGRGEGDRPVERAPDQLAYVIFTSGSTGLPKGAMVRHRGMVNHLFAKVKDLELAPADVVAQNSPQSFDISVWQFLAALMVGGRTHVFSDAVAYDPAELLRQVDGEGITVFEAVPAVLRAMLDHARAPEGRAVSLSRLRWLIPTGEAFPPQLSREWFERYPHLAQMNAYGPTECSDDVTHHVMRAPPAPGAASLPIGRPVANTRIYILDGRGEPVPVGITGEIHVGGDGVGLGYLNDPGKTRAAFVPDPFAGVPGAQMYRTGDLGRWRPDGVIEFLGRNDAQVKVRGLRIEPGEIEAVLSAHEAVREARVLLREDQPGEKRLVAYVVGSVEVDGLRAHLRQGLPEYMVPAAFVFLEALPLTPNGKLDRKALPAPEYAADADRYVAPRTPVEEVLAGIWAEVLRLERVGVEESFFDLGGHSLLATRVAARVHEVFGVELPLRALFERPVLSGLAAEIERLRGTGAVAGEGAIAPAAREGDLPVTCAPERLWVVAALDPGRPVSALPCSYRLTGGLDGDALRRALTELVRRHEPLRTTLP